MAPDDQPTVALPTPALLKDRYLLGRKLGEGGFGSVYLARDLALHDRPVVVKIQLHQSGDDPWFERKFSEEIRALSMIDHPGVVGAIDSGRTAEGKPFLVMQYVEGVTLRTVLTPEGLPFARAADILRQMGHALAAAHEKGIWHRDLKPENLMLQTMPGGGERVRLIDFGIATVRDFTADPSKTRVAGSLAYMAPEQRTGQPSAATDIYAMGLIARELLPGKLPLQTDRLIARSLSRDPAARPADAREFGDQLYRSLVSSDVTRVTETTPQKRRGNWKVVGVAALVVGSIGANYLFKQPVAKPASAPVPVHADKPVPVELPKPEATPKPLEADPLREKDAWDAAKWSGKMESYQAYVDRYPEGRHAMDARKKIAVLERKERDRRK